MRILAGEIFTYAEDMSFQYDGLNQLKSAVEHSASTYTYNGDGLRETKTVDGVTTTQVLDGGNVADNYIYDEWETSQASQKELRIHSSTQGSTLARKLR